MNHHETRDEVSSMIFNYFVPVDIQKIQCSTEDIHACHLPESTNVILSMSLMTVFHTLVFSVEQGF